MGRRTARTYFDENTEPLDQRIVVGLHKVGLALKHEAWRSADGQRLSPTQAQILIVLANEAGLRPSAVAAKLAVTLATVSESVRTLASKGLIEKRPDATDARSTLLDLTPRGRREAARSAGWSDFLAGAVDALSAHEQAAFHVGLIKMIRTLQERGQVPVSGMCVTCRHFRPYAHSDSKRPHHCAFVDASLAVTQLRLECAEHEAADGKTRLELWNAFAAPHAPAR